jgi:hypothetical protein
MLGCGFSKQNPIRMLENESHFVKSDNSFNANFVEKKKFLFEYLKDTKDLVEFQVGNNQSNDLNAEEIEQIIKTKDAAHYYKLVSVQRQTKFYTAIVVLYVMEGGNKQYLITIDNSGNFIDDIVVHNNHRIGPQQLAEGKVLLLGKVSSEFRNKEILVKEEQSLTESYSKNARSWRESYISTYSINDNGLIQFKEKRQVK